MRLHTKITLFFIIIACSTSLLIAQVEVTESGMRWYPLEEAQQKAKEEGKKVLIFGYTDWCTYCRKMRRVVYPDSAVQHTIYKYYYPVQLNGESEETVVFNGKELKASELAGYLRLNSLPTHYFLDENGEILGGQPGFFPKEVFTPLLRYVGTDSFGKMKFDEFVEAGN